jgi:uncharacterized DUF497 family protein
MHSGRVVSDNANRRHITLDHPDRRITVADVDEVLHDPDRVEARDEQRGTHLVVGRTAGGRALVVAYVLRPGDVRYPVHARPAGRRALRELQR